MTLPDGFSMSVRGTRAMGAFPNEGEAVTTTHDFSFHLSLTLATFFGNRKRLALFGFINSFMMKRLDVAHVGAERLRNLHRAILLLEILDYGDESPSNNSRRIQRVQERCGR